MVRNILVDSARQKIGPSSGDHWNDLDSGKCRLFQKNWNWSGKSGWLIPLASEPKAVDKSWSDSNLAKFYSIIFISKGYYNKPKSTYDGEILVTQKSYEESKPLLSESFKNLKDLQSQANPQTISAKLRYNRLEQIISLAKKNVVLKQKMRKNFGPVFCQNSFDENNEKGFRNSTTFAERGFG